MFPKVLRRCLIGMSLFMTVVTVTVIVTHAPSTFMQTSTSMKAFYTATRSFDGHVNVALPPKATGAKHFFAKTLKQAHQQLGKKRDLVEGSDFEGWRQRADHLSEACNSLKDKTLAAVDTVQPLTYYNKTGVLYCPAAKVASKFWARMLYVLETDDYISPFEFAGAKHTYSWWVQPTKGMSERNRNKYVKDLKDSTFTFMFTRNPYKRIFSSYVDKFVNPNPKYWEYGREIIAFARKSPSNKSLECGHDVKFSELVTFLLAGVPAEYDAHFKPVSVFCDVCNIKYDFVGKVETFKQDVMVVMNRTQASKHRILVKDFGQENSIHYIISNTMQAFQLMKGSLKCVTSHVVHMRLWRMLQISGLIEKQFSYPLTPEESSQASITTITNLFLNAYHRSSSTAKLNTKDARHQAYTEIPLEDMESLRLKYLNDLMLFDYEDRPDEFFIRDESSQNRGDFDFFDILPRVS